MQKPDLLVKESTGNPRIPWYRRLAGWLINLLDGHSPWRLLPVNRLGNHHRTDALNHPERLHGSTVIHPAGFQGYAMPSFLSDRPTKREGNRRETYRRDVPVVPVPPLTIHVLEQVGMTGSEGLLYSISDRAWIRESMLYWFDGDDDYTARFRYAIHRPEPTRIPGLTLSIAKPAATGYYHFLIESLPRLQALMRQFPAYDQVVVSVSAGSREFVNRWLSFIGIPESKRIYAEGTSHLQFDLLAFTNNWVPQYQPHTRAIQSVLNLIPPATAARSGRWILASRQDMEHRQLGWEQDLLNQIPKLERILFNTLSPADTVNLMSETTVLVGMHGAALSNMIWMPPGGTILEILPGVFEPLYYRLSAVCGHRHILADGSDPDSLIEALSRMQPDASGLPTTLNQDTHA